MKIRTHLNILTAGSVAFFCATPAWAQLTPDTAPSSDPLAQAGSLSSTSPASSWNTTTAGEDRYSWMPYTHNGYVGANLGGAFYDTHCGVGSCDDPDIAGKIYTGGMFNRFVGLELAYLHMGRAERGGGKTYAQGGNLSVVLRVPLSGDTVSLFGLAGATYGRTKTTASANSGVATGKETGWGPSFGAGVAVALTPRWQGVAQWERHRFEFAGDNTDWVDQATIGLKYVF